jgi:hypothetical protein
VHIDQRDMRLGRPDQAQSLLCRTRFPTNAYIRLLQDHPETGPHQLVIINEYNINHLALCLDW